MVDNSADAPLLVKIQIVLVNLGLLGAVKDGQNVRGMVATLVQEWQ